MVRVQGTVRNVYIGLMGAITQTPSGLRDLAHYYARVNNTYSCRTQYICRYN